MYETFAVVQMDESDTEFDRIDGSLWKSQSIPVISSKKASLASDHDDVKSGSESQSNNNVDKQQHDAAENQHDR